jgi:O-antigen/teichoic acid export membrane protein
MLWSISWSLAGGWVIKGVGVLKMVLLARLLSPQDFGAIGVLVLATNGLGVFSDIGIGAALIQKQQLDRRDLDTAWTLILLRGILLFGLLCAGAGPLAWYFDEPALEPAFRAVAVCFLLEGGANIGTVFFQRDVKFKQKVRLDVAADFAGALSAMLLALVLRDFWALVWASLIWRLTYLGLSYRMHPYRPRLCWDRKRALQLIHFGKHVFWISVVTFIVTNGDDALVGRVLSLELLGYYTLAYTIANLPVSGFCEAVGRISFPVYAQMQENRQRLNTSFQKVLRSGLLMLLPLTGLMVLLAEDFIRLVLGDRWLPMTGVLQVLCLLGFLRGVSNLVAPVHLAVNRPGRQSRSKAAELGTFALLVYPFTVHWGLMGTAWAVSGVYLVGLAVSLHALTGMLQNVPQVLGGALRGPVTATTAMIGAVLAAAAVAEAWSPLTRFVFCGAAAAIAFLPIALWMNRSDVRDALCGLLPPAPPRSVGG